METLEVEMTRRSTEKSSTQVPPQQVLLYSRPAALYRKRSFRDRRAEYDDDVDDDPPSPSFVPPAPSVLTRLGARRMLARAVRWHFACGEETRKRSKMETLDTVFEFKSK